MKLHSSTIDPSNPQPCSHMRNLVSSLADGSAHGVAQWYTRLHVKGCPNCNAALDAYTSVISRLKGFELTGNQDMSLSPDRRDKVEFALDQIEKEHKEA